MRKKDRFTGQEEQVQKNPNNKSQKVNCEILKGGGGER